MKTHSERTKIAEWAIQALKAGIENKSKRLILATYDMIESDEGFEWDNLDELFYEWNDMIDHANNILFKD